MNSNSTLVSVCLLTYNQEKFISESIESVLSQKTEYEFEICIGEDDSSDRTREICQKYAEKNPNIIRLFLRSRKDVILIDGKATGAFNFFQTIKACRGKYIFFLEGDDYWTDQNKIQKQVEFMEANPGVMLSFHNSRLVDEQNNLLSENLVQLAIGERLQTERIIEAGSLAPSASICMRAELFEEIPEWYSQNPSDWKLEILSTLKGEMVYFSSDCMSAYRIQKGGIYSGEKVINQIRSIERIIHDLSEVSLFAEYSRELRKRKTHIYQNGYSSRSLTLIRRLYFLWKHFLVFDQPLFFRIRHLSSFGLRITINRIKRCFR